jgi:hypothetical protein
MQNCSKGPEVNLKKQKVIGTKKIESALTRQLMGTESYISCMSLSKKPAKFY